MMRLIFIIFLVSVALKLQANDAGKPWSLQHQLPQLTAIKNFSQPEEPAQELNNAVKALIYAVGIETSLKPETVGQWDTIPSKGYVWRLGIHANNALSLNLLIENYLMKQGMALYVYDNDMKIIVGPFDTSYNSNGGILPVQSISGNFIVIEWNIPLHTTINDYFNIINIGYGFRGIEDQFRKIPLSANDCNIDVNCMTGNHWQRENRSVVRLQTTVWNVKTNTWVSQYCSGVLINQAVSADRKKPYILTAAHCIENSEEAQRTVVVFGYEKPYCDGPTIAVPQGISGTVLVASKRELDFSLLEITANKINIDTHRPFYAGWCRSGTPPQGVVGIHHPQGDLKKISVSSSLLRTSSFSSASTDVRTTLVCDPNTHWRVARWDEGLTEGGSSGSPIFNSERKIVGILSGGPPAYCGNARNDEYSKLSEQWNRYSRASESLRQWLDPNNTGVTSIFGYDPITLYEGKYDLRGNIGENENISLKKSDEWGYLTSLNDQHWISFAEKMINDTIVHLIGMEVNVAKVSKPGVNVKFGVWLGESFPVTPLYQTDMVVTSDFEDYKMRVFFEDKIKIEGNYFIGYTLESTSAKDTFAVYHSPVRPYSGISSMYVEDVNGLWTPLKDATPPIYISLGVKAIGSFSKRNQDASPPVRQNNLKILYQPGTDVAVLLFSVDEPYQSLQTVTIECFDTAGKRMMVLKNVKGTMDMINERIYLQVEMNISSLPPGVYIINTFDDKKNRQSGKMVIWR